MHADRVPFVRELDPKKILLSLTARIQPTHADREHGKEADPFLIQKNSFLSLTVRIQLMHAARVLFVRDLDPKKFLFATDSAHSADARRSRALRSRT